MFVVKKYVLYNGSFTADIFEFASFANTVLIFKFFLELAFKN